MSALPSSSRLRRGGFTLLEVVIAMSILVLALMAIFDLNAGAVASHAYTKRLTVATLLAKSKMTDLEQQLYDDGFPADDDEESGDFSEEGWPQFKWRARILAPRTQNVSPDQFLSALFNVPGGMSGLTSMFGGGGEEGQPAAGGPDQNPLSALGPMAGLAQTQFTQMIEQIGQTVREVHLTVAWQDGSQTETIDLVTHVVSLGQGSDRNSQGTTTGNGPNGAQVPGARGRPGPNGELGLPSNPNRFRGVQ